MTQTIADTATDPKRVKLEALTPPPSDRVVASQISDSTASAPPITDGSSSGTSANCGASSDISPASTASTTSDATQLHDFALKFRDIQLPEDCPRLAAYHPLCKQTEKDVARLCNDFITTYSQRKVAGFVSDELQSICDQLSGLRDVRKHYPFTKPVALAGPMGAGKSRTINSILGQQGLALDSDASDRGTNVVHEYLGPEVGQKTKYRVNVVYYSSSQLNIRISSIVRAAYEYLSYENGDEEVDPDDVDDLRAKFNSSLDFFRTVLCDFEEFDSRDTATAFFEEHSKAKTEEDDLVELLENLFHDFKDSRKIVNDVESFSASDETELSRIFAQVSKPQDADLQHPHPWPIIHRLQVCVRDSDLLKKGALISDTPGIADSDRLVVDSTMMYLQDVDSVLIVSPILRTQRLNDLNDMLRQCLTLGKAERTYLVMTKIDQKDVIKLHERASLKPQFLQALEAAEVQQRKLMTEMEDLDIKKDLLFAQLSDPSKAVEFHATYLRLQELPSLIKQQEAKIFQVGVQARNYDTEQLLKNKFRDLAKSGRAPDLKTIFISNEEYQLLAQDKPARLDLETTGIPGLKRILYQVPAGDKFGTLQRIVKNQIAVSFRGAIFSLMKTKLERKAEVESCLVKALQQDYAISRSMKTSLERIFEQTIAEAFDASEAEWQKKAKRLLADWEAYCAGNFAAFCRRGGEWAPLKKLKKGEKRDKKKKRVTIQWNALIQDIFSSDVTKMLDDFWTGFDEAEKHVHSSVRDWVHRLEETLKACPDFQGAPDTAMFYEMLHECRELIQKAVRQITRTLRRELMSVTHRVHLQDDIAASFVDNAMRATYDEAAKVKPEHSTLADGKKVSRTARAHQARVNLIRCKFMGTGTAPTDGETGPQRGAQLSVFQSVFEQFQASLNAKVEAAISEILSKLKATSNEILADFNLRYSVEDDVDTNDPQMKEELLNAAQQALRLVKGPIQQQLQECKRWEKEGDLVLKT